MTSDFPVIIDANVLIQAAVRDTLLRLSERRLFLCRWSDDIIEEVRRNLIARLGRSEQDADYLVGELRMHFADAWVADGYKELIPAMRNEPKDRHVVAAAIKCGAEVILSYNTKHFPADWLQAQNIVAKTPDEYLVDLYSINPEIVVHVLHQQGAELNPPRNIESVLKSLDVCRCYAFTGLIRQNLDL
uniref:PIN domain-containing protein n=1 Tax=Acidobacterium capsulatum TaxID=33075 RepID=A0A7V5CU69_9BACT